MTYYLQVFGCQMNRSDAERIAGLFDNLGLKPAQNKNQTDIYIVVMCSVRQMAADRIFGLKNTISQIKKNNPRAKSILTGCTINADKERFAKIFDHTLDIKTLAGWPSLIGLKNGSIINDDYFHIPARKSSKFSSLIPISKGCDNYCTYCVVPYTRGPLESRSADNILAEVRDAVNSGSKEIWLLGQNVNNYHWNNTDFAKLLYLVNNIPGEFWIRFTSPHPKDFTDAAVNVMAKCGKVTPYLNLPIQSGNNAILKAMGRPYTIETYKTLVKKIREAFTKHRAGLEKEVALSTDVIVGFPGETKAQFNNTANAFRSIKYDMAYIAQYSRRAGTAAAKLDDNVSQNEKKIRENTINDIVKKTALRHNKKYVGKTVAVLVDSIDAINHGYGKNRNYKTVKFEITGERTSPGDIVDVKITKALPFGLYGSIITGKEKE